MQTEWIEPEKLEKSLQRNEAFWRGELEEYPLMWITVPNAKSGETLIEPQNEQELWTNVDYRMVAAENELWRTYYAGDSLPVFNPWLGPDQVAAWLGADIILKPKEFTSWVKPFVDDWEKFPKLQINPDNKWWNLYLETVRASIELGKGKWVTAYPDLHTGIDGLCAIRGPENLMVDMLQTPEAIHRAMQQMTDLWKCVVDTVSEIIIPAGQGTSNWTMGWSEKRFICIGQNDFTCMISPEMFIDFCWDDNLQCCDYVDYTLYHLDGPEATRHLPKLLELQSLNAIQWIQGAGNPLPSKWTKMLSQIQKSGKLVQLYYGPGHGEEADLINEIEVLCTAMDPTKLFIWTFADSVEKAEEIIKYTRELCSQKRQKAL